MSIDINELTQSQKIDLYKNLLNDSDIKEYLSGTNSSLSIKQIKIRVLSINEYRKHIENNDFNGSINLNDVNVWHYEKLNKCNFVQDNTNDYARWLNNLSADLPRPKFTDSSYFVSPWDKWNYTLNSINFDIVTDNTTNKTKIILNSDTPTKLEFYVYYAKNNTLYYFNYDFLSISINKNFINQIDIPFKRTSDGYTWDIYVPIKSAFRPVFEFTETKKRVV